MSLPTLLDRIKVVHADITEMEVDVIVNAANEHLLGGAGVDGAIHEAAGPELLEECKKLHGCPTGKAKITKGYDLPAKYVIHTPGPIWRGGHDHERDLLASCYRSCIELAQEYNAESIAFPAISTGIYRFPVGPACLIAIRTIVETMREDDGIKQVLLVGYDTLTTMILEDSLATF
jgi:O-acetyl-ADP-ribose deacetylase